ncbi:MAG: hypothetical protein ACRDY1_13505, partial [Acidimicrobiales bacterium]
VVDGEPATGSTAVEGTPHDEPSVAVGPEPAAAVEGAPAPAPEEIGTGPVDEDESSRKQAVDDLFARLRAERGRAEEAGPPATAPPVASTAAGSPSVPAPIEVVADPLPPAAGDDADDPPTASVDDEAPDPLLAERDDMLGPIVATLARRLKRALQDDQNDILDRVRANGGWGPDILPSADDHQRRYVTAGAEHLLDAARSGAAFAGGKPDDAPRVDAIAGELASAIVGPLRRRLDGAGGSVDVGDDSALIEHVGAAFRDWKGGRVERLAGDHALAAFSQGSLAAADPAISLRWIVDDGGTQCPDCDDNALAGSQRPGDSFPTGHSCPPAHAGCRCLLAPVEA